MNWLLLVATCCLVCLSSSCVVNSSREWPFCGTGQFLDTFTCTCHNCTFTCPVNQIIRRSCSPVSDSVCGPFFELEPKVRKGPKNRKNKKNGHRPTTLSDQVQLHSIGGNRTRGELPSFNSTFELYADQLKGDYVRKEAPSNSNRCLYVTLFISAAAAFLVVVTAVATVAKVMTRRNNMAKKTVFRGHGPSPPNHYYNTMNSSGQAIAANRNMTDTSLIHIESQVMWNSQRRNTFDQLLGRNRDDGNDYVKESGLKTTIMPLPSSSSID